MDRTRLLAALALVLLFCGLSVSGGPAGEPTVAHSVPSRSASSVGSPPGRPVLGGKVSPDGTVEIRTDLPRTQKKENVGGRDGEGLCVFTSIEWAARWQNERELFDFQRQMRAERGGGWPEKVDRMIAKYAPGVSYVQHTGGDFELLKRAVETGRMVGVTYDGRDPHYRGRIAHMVNCVYASDGWCCISDNNYPGDNDFVWMSAAEFQRRWRGNRRGWFVCLLSPPPPPCPHN